MWWYGIIPTETTKIYSTYILAKYNETSCELPDMNMMNGHDKCSYLKWRYNKYNWY